MKKSNAIDGSLNFIENLLTSLQKRTVSEAGGQPEEINIATLAEQSYFSKTHYQRLFRAIVGEPVMEYVKNRRLQLACRDLVTSKASILDISLNYGYDSHDGFTRAFKAYFGVTPSEYRRREKSSKTEVGKMISNEVMNRIGQNAERISAALTNFIEEAELLIGNANKTAKESGVSGKGVIITANELGNMAERMRKLRDDDVKGLVKGSAFAFEMSDQILFLMRCIDDMVFQMNLLRFLSGVETGRISPPKDEFEAIDASYAKLCGELESSKQNILKLMAEAVELLQTDIRQEAANRLDAAVKAAHKAAEEGESTAASMGAAAASLGGNDREFKFIEERIKETITILKNAADCFANTGEFNDAILQMQHAAYNTNINAFNAAIASARAGDTSDDAAAANKVRNYARVLQQTAGECESLCAEYKRLTDLTIQDGKQSEQALAEKHIDDLIFQSAILSGQFALEAERINRDTFRTLAQAAGAAHMQFVQSRDIVQCCKSVEEFLQNLNKEFSALEVGGSFAYFEREYEMFLNRIIYI